MYQPQVYPPTASPAGQNVAMPIAGSLPTVPPMMQMPMQQQQQQPIVANNPLHHLTYNSNNGQMMLAANHHHRTSVARSMPTGHGYLNGMVPNMVVDAAGQPYPVNMAHYPHHHQPQRHNSGATDTGQMPQQQPLGLSNSIPRGPHQGELFC